MYHNFEEYWKDNKVALEKENIKKKIAEKLFDDCMTIAMIALCVTEKKEKPVKEKPKKAPKKTTTVKEEPKPERVRIHK